MRVGILGSGLIGGVSGYSPLKAGVAFLPMTIANYAMAIAVPRLTQRLGNARLLAGASPSR